MGTLCILAGLALGVAALCKLLSDFVVHHALLAFFASFVLVSFGLLLSRADEPRPRPTPSGFAIPQ
jgi:hypothetical protein